MDLNIHNVTVHWTFLSECREYFDFNIFEMVFSCGLCRTRKAADTDCVLYGTTRATFKRCTNNTR